MTITLTRGMFCAGTAWYLFSCGVALADVTIHRITTFSGLAGMGASEMSGIERLQGEKMRIESSHRFTGSILSRLTNESSDASIVRVDKDLIWELDPQTQRYRERPLSQLAEVFDENRNEHTADPSKPEAESEPTSKPAMKITRNEVTVKRAGKSKQINDYNCEKYVIDWLVEAQDTESGATILNNMTSILWTAPEVKELKTLRSEQERYNQALAKKLNIKLSPTEQQTFGIQAMQGLLGSLDTEKLGAELGKVKGVPIVVDVTWRTLNNESSDAPQNGEIATSSPAETPDLGAMAMQVGNAVGGLFGKKPTPEPEETTNDSGNIIFQSRTEIKKVEVSSLDESLFEIPAKFEKN